MAVGGVVGLDQLRNVYIGDYYHQLESMGR